MIPPCMISANMAHVMSIVRGYASDSNTNEIPKNHQKAEKIFCEYSAEFGFFVSPPSPPVARNPVTVMLCSPCSFEGASCKLASG